MTVALTQALGAYVASPGMDNVPQDVLPTIRNGFIDTLACMLSGRLEQVTLAAKGLALERGSRGGSSVLLGSEKMGAMDAAFVNAVSAHALDYDDMALNGHPSVVLVPALLATGECIKATDQDLLRAYLVGYEVWAELMGREPDSLHNKGWHPTSVIGTVAVAAAVAHLEKLTAIQSSHAMGIAASMSCGLMGNFGSMTKPLHAGWAASHGIESVRLAKLGATSSTHILEGGNGYLAAFSPNGRADRGPWVAPTDLRIRRNGLSIKKYPLCYAAHRVIDGILDLRRTHGFTADDVVKVTPSLSSVTAKVLHSHSPKTALEAKFSIEFAVAMSVSDGAVGLSQVTDEQVSRHDIQAQFAKVDTRIIEPDCPVEPGFAMHDRVEIQLRDGRKLDSGPIRFARGHVSNPLTASDIHTKFLGCVAPQEVEIAQKWLKLLDGLGENNNESLFAALDSGSLSPF